MDQRTLVGVLVVLMFGGFSSVVAANPLDAFEVGARESAMGGAGTASSDGIAAMYYNPAAAGIERDFVLLFGVSANEDSIEVNGTDAEIDAHVRYTAGLSSALPLWDGLGERLRFGLLLSIPHGHFYDLQLPDEQSPHFPLLDQGPRRLLASAALAFELFEGLHLGVGASVMPHVRGDVHIDIADEQGDNNASVLAEYDVGAEFGIRYDVLSWFSLGIAYRMAKESEIDIPVDVRISDAIPPVYARLSSVAYSMPHTLRIGAAVSPLEELGFSADVVWSKYSDFHGPNPVVWVYDASGRVVQESRAASSPLSDTLAIHLGGEWRFLEDWALRAGYAYVPSPVPAQEGAANQLDADRHCVSAGLGFELQLDTERSTQAIELGLHGSLMLLDERSFEKTEFLPGAAGFPSLSMSGLYYGAGAEMKLRF
ncbi:MAG: outer membrane protein transport protein [Myxococcota bacterium]|nr:outer membrane protein transport protein [Myxococcota bacterium]